MPKFRKKPVIIEAEQYLGDDIMYGDAKPIRGVCTSETCRLSGHQRPHVHTIHKNQAVILEAGDWIIPEPDGEHFYPCKADIFERTYEPVEE
jgi:hypothetical protein